MLRKARNLDLPYDIQLDLFNKMIKPILLYGSEIWGTGNCDILERVQLKFLKYTFKLKKSTPSHMIYGELGIMPISTDIKSRVNGKKVSGLDYWLSRELNCEVPQIICYYVCQENSYHIKVK